MIAGVAVVSATILHHAFTYAKVWGRSRSLAFRGNRLFLPGRNWTQASESANSGHGGCHFETTSGGYLKCSHSDVSRSHDVCSGWRRLLLYVVSRLWFWIRSDAGNNSISRLIITCSTKCADLRAAGSIIVSPSGAFLVEGKRYLQSLISSPWFQSTSKRSNTQKSFASKKPRKKPIVFQLFWRFLRQTKFLCDFTDRLLRKICWCHFKRYVLNNSRRYGEIIGRVFH